MGRVDVHRLLDLRVLDSRYGYRYSMSDSGILYPFEARICKRAMDIIRRKIKQSNIHDIRVKSPNRGCPIEAGDAHENAVEKERSRYKRHS